MVAGNRDRICKFGLMFALALTACEASAQDAEAIAEMARKAQDPLGNVQALMTDNTIAFDGGPEDDTSYGFQLQPVYSIPNGTQWNMIARAVVPILGTEPGVVLPPLGSEPRPDSGSSWGLSDSVLQFILSPKSDSAWKWGIGPQASVKTRSSSRQAGPGWGGGLAGVLFGGIGDWSIGAIAMQHWGEDDFNLGSLQIIAMYNFPEAPGYYVGYNNSITYNWDASSDDRLTLPLGAVAGRTLLLGNGDGLDLNVGIYGLVVKPQDAPSWQLKFGISYFFN